MEKKTVPEETVKNVLQTMFSLYKRVYSSMASCSITEIFPIERFVRLSVEEGWKLQRVCGRNRKKNKRANKEQEHQRTKLFHA